MPRKPFTAGDYFAIPLGDPSAPTVDDPVGLGQILSIEQNAMASFGCAFWPDIERSAEHQIGKPPFIVSLITTELLKSRKWKVQGNAPIHVPDNVRRYEQFRSKEWVGAKIVGAGIIRVALRAFHGLEDWDGYHDPDYITKLLQPGVEIPKHARFNPGV
ncbi:MAG: hypothetical protein WA136_12600 [Rhodoferax sp.]